MIVPWLSRAETVIYWSTTLGNGTGIGRVLDLRNRIGARLDVPTL